MQGSRLYPAGRGGCAGGRRCSDRGSGGCAGGQCCSVRGSGGCDSDQCCSDPGSCPAHLGFFQQRGCGSGSSSPDAFHEFRPKGERWVLVSGGRLDFPCLHLFKFKLICYLLVFSYSRQLAVSIILREFRAYSVASHSHTHAHTHTCVHVRTLTLMGTTHIHTRARTLTHMCTCAHTHTHSHA